MKKTEKISRKIIYLPLLIAIILGLSSTMTHAKENDNQYSNWKNYPYTLVEEENDPYVSKDFINEEIKNTINEKTKAFLYTNKTKGIQRLYLFWWETSGSYKVKINDVSRDGNGNVIMNMHRDEYDPHTCDMRCHLFVLELSSTDFQISDNLKLHVSTTAHIDDTEIVYDENGHIDLEHTITKFREEEKDPVEYNLKFNDIGSDDNNEDKQPPVQDTKEKQKIKVKTFSKTVKKRNLKKKGKTVKVITVKNAVGTVRYEFVKPGKKIKRALKINPKTGKITIRKGTKKGIYQPMVKITVTDEQYETFTKTVKGKIIVK